jgi:hypothetical protein
VKSVVRQNSELGGAVDSSKGYLIWWLFAPFVVLMFYVLSVGPIVKLANKGLIPKVYSESICFPLLEATQHNKAATRFMLWYVLDVWHAMGPLRSEHVLNPDG